MESDNAVKKRSSGIHRKPFCAPSIQLIDFTAATIPTKQPLFPIKMEESAGASTDVAQETASGSTFSEFSSGHEGAENDGGKDDEGDDGVGGDE